MKKGRLGLEGARIPQRDRHGIMWLSRCQLSVDSGTLQVTSAGDGELAAGRYDIPYQAVSCFVLGPGTTLTHDVFRLLARHGTGLVFSGTDGVRMYASMPYGPDSSDLARRQVERWTRPDDRIRVALAMYRLRMGGELPSTDLNALRGIEGYRVKETYRLMAQQYGVRWSGRRYDRSNPEGDDRVNAAVNHASAAVRAAAHVAVAVSGAIPQLGFIHESSGIAFCLDIADLFRESLLLPAAFAALGGAGSDSSDELERRVRKGVGREIRSKRIIAQMIDHIKEVLDADDGDRGA